MFGPLSRKAPASRETALLTARLDHARLLLDRLLAQQVRTGSFLGALPQDLPRQMTEDGLELACHPTHRVGVTAADRVFGIEVASATAQTLAARVPGGPTWGLSPTRRGGLEAQTHIGHSTIAFSCFDCAVDPFFNNRPQPGVRLIGQVKDKPPTT